MLRIKLRHDTARGKSWKLSSSVQYNYDVSTHLNNHQTYFYGHTHVSEAMINKLGSLCCHVSEAMSRKWGAYAVVLPLAVVIEVLPGLKNPKFLCAQPVFVPNMVCEYHTFC